MVDSFLIKCRWRLVAHIFICCCVKALSELHGFDEQRAQEFALLAGAAGCTHQSLESWSCGYKCSIPLSNVKVCGGDPIQAYVASWGAQCVMAFQGTHDVVSFLDDLRVNLHSVPWEPCQGCRVHSGFLSAYSTLKPCLLEALESRGCGKNGRSVSSTGWSLGAAVSSLAMLDLVHSGWQIAESYDFGKPRFGDAKLSSIWQQTFLNVSVWRVTHAMDPVPHLPLEAWSYSDLGHEAYYPAGVMAGHAECVMGGDLRCSAQHAHLSQDLLHVWDHFEYMGVRQGKGNCSYGVTDSGSAILHDASEIPKAFTTPSQAVWSSCSLLCTLILWTLYFKKPRLRRTPGWLILRASVCEALASACFILIFVLGGNACVSDLGGSATMQSIWRLYLIIAASEVSANTWRLTMFCNLMVIYRNPFKPERHRRLYSFLAAFIPVVTTVTLGLNFKGTSSAQPCNSETARREYMRVLLFGFYVLPFIIFVAMGGLLFAGVMCLVKWTERINRREDRSRSPILSLSRQRVFRHGLGYLFVHGLLLALGLLAIVGNNSTSSWWRHWLLREALVALTCGRPCFSFIGWFLINNLPYEVCGLTWPRCCCDDPAMRPISSLGQPGSPLIDDHRLVVSGLSGDDVLATRTRMSNGQLLAVGFKRELRLELLLDVMESIREATPRPPSFMQQGGSQLLEALDSEAQVRSCPLALSTHLCKRRRPPCYEADKFRHLRHLFGFDDSTYAAAFPADLGEGWQQRLLESVSEGASGSFFYRVISQCHTGEPISNFIVKQITEAEKDMLMRILDPYVEHVQRRDGRSLIQYLGCHSVDLRWKCSGEVYFVVMRNFLPVKPWLLFDLKGATANRRALKAEQLHESNLGGADARYGTLRDWEWMDIAMTVDISDRDKASVDEMIRADAEFLARQRLLDYSLLVGILCLDRRGSASAKVNTEEREVRLAALKAAGGYVSVDRQKVYFFGIIDVLERYNLRWQAQHVALTAAYRVACKGQAADGISAMSPCDYADRFCTFIRQEVLQLRPSIVEPVLRTATSRNLADRARRCFCPAREVASPSSRGSRERWSHLWERRRRGLVRERLDLERQHAMSRIRELQAQIDTLEGLTETALKQSTVPGSDTGTSAAGVAGDDASASLPLPTEALGHVCE